jgi:exopolyphosphatase/guanosine-5'-triphosphate,3'-diphosphate pyrophosphatase
MLGDTMKQLGKRDVDLCIAVGGNAETLARIAGDEPDDGATSAGPFVDKQSLRSLADRLLELTPSERAKKYDLNPDRVDTIVPAAVLLNFIIERLGLKGFHSPSIGLRDGILAELAEQAAGTFDLRAAQRSVVSEAERLGEHYQYDPAHAAKVREHAMAIFDALRAHHCIAARDAERERMLLAVASTIHDVGEFIGYAHHHKHGYYIISNSEIGGVSADDMRVVAVAVRYHRRAHPSDRHPEYASLARDERKRVSRIAAILRLADALDREHHQKIQALKISIRRRELVLQPYVVGDCFLERWAVENKGELLQQVFGLKILFVAGKPARAASPGRAGLKSQK